MISSRNTAWGEPPACSIRREISSSVPPIGCEEEDGLVRLCVMMLLELGSTVR